MLTHRQVEAFRAVMLTGRVTAAAEMLRITQPAVTRLIRDLQTATHLRLFQRQGSRLLPTGEASALYLEVERSFVGLDRIRRARGTCSSTRSVRSASPACPPWSTATC